MGRLALPEFREESMLNSQGPEPAESLLTYLQSLDVPVNNLALLHRALTHRSYLNEHPEALQDNERLEFLGDAVLDFLVGAWVFTHYPEMAEGEMTRLRSALVRTDQLADFGQQIGLGKYMFLGRGEDENGGRNRAALLCGTFEALIGAIYLDAGIQAVEAYLEPFLQRATYQIIITHRTVDPKSVLQEYVQAHGESPPQYRTVAAYGPDHAKIFEVEVLIDGTVAGQGSGRSKQAAAKAAARMALQSLELS